MYSYQHAFHAGNFADVHKHLALISTLIYLNKKSTPYTALDLFSGEGIYDLTSPQAQQNKEHADGFDKIKTINEPPLLVNELIKQAELLSTQRGKEAYPGSPWLILQYLRNTDDGVFCENHPTSFNALKKHISKSALSHVHQRDAYEAINALLPFNTKRGFIFVDPSYEVKSEYAKLKSLIEKCHTKYQHLIFLIWYPILKEGYHHELTEILKNQNIKKLWHHQWRPFPDALEGMLGSGLLMINPPWGINHQMTETFDKFEKIYKGSTQTSQWFER